MTIRVTRFRYSPTMSSVDKKLEQRCNVKFLVKLGKTRKDAYELLTTVYGEDVMNQVTFYKWYKAFKEGRENITDEPREGRPSTSRSEVLKNTAAAIVSEDRRITVRELAATLDISVGSAFSILHDDLAMRRVSCRWIPRLLTPEQMQHRVSVCQDLLSRFGGEANEQMCRIITVDESWMYHYDPELKQQSSQWKRAQSPPPKKAKLSRSAGKVMMIIFFDSEGFLYQHAVPQGQTVTAAYYKSVLITMLRHFKKKRPHKIVNEILLHHDNARPHVAQSVVDFLNARGIATIPHPPYSPDLAPCDFWLFPAIKFPLRGRKFKTNQEVIKAVEARCKELEKDGLAFVFKKWQERWQKCIITEGGYFEKEHVDLED